MKKRPSLRASRFPYLYEAFIWLMYVALYKYDYYLRFVPAMDVGHTVFPFRNILLYAIATSLYMILYYRWLAPMLFKRRWYWLFAVMVIVYFGYVSKLNYWTMSELFAAWNGQPLLDGTFESFRRLDSLRLRHLLSGWDLRILATDFVTFSSVFFVRYAFENEEKKHLLETDNLVLQLESLKAQLHPHFLFNTLNSLYGMSLTQSPDTPAFILKLSDMLRYVLYDCQQHKVPLEKDAEFLLNYLDMEKKRYPDAQIDFQVSINDGSIPIAPLLFISFVENSFKHGAHRINPDGFVRGSLTQAGHTLTFVVENDILEAGPPSHPYGGIGLENARKRLELYYPGRYELQAGGNGRIFTVTLRIQLND
ncbi:histidine kinase [Chitinophaga lutea]|uniref:Histidine kinase n=1 Tax=Chitinophaga lutea TaxID=2488634 RepID=A0A3N4PXE1_9BACT|nr:histidine kinase [Chitinophaga lutea]RPE08747.1 histidine kinase [Chitinophaga lutea]